MLSLTTPGLLKGTAPRVLVVIMTVPLTVALRLGTVLRQKHLLTHMMGTRHRVRDALVMAILLSQNVKGGLLGLVMSRVG